MPVYIHSFMHVYTTHILTCTHMHTYAHWHVFTPTRYALPYTCVHHVHIHVCCLSFISFAVDRSSLREKGLNKPQ